jgi:hypothetical protein
MLAIEFPAWHEEQARNWLESIATILDGGLPPLLPLKSASNPENTNELKLKDDFLKIRLGNYPYDNSILNGTILKNMPFETDVRSVMSSRFPWLYE